VSKDFSAADDLTARDPEKLKQMQRLFDSGGPAPRELAICTRVICTVRFVPIRR
jgi:hypothetical protein